jgi:quinoprotein glucose dehydrogenase
VYYPGTGLPATHNGAFFLCDFRGTAGGSGVHEFFVEQNGASYRLVHDEMFARNVLATDCDFGPDGGLYIADWIDGWTGLGKGRIHRVVSDDVDAGKAAQATAAVLKQVPHMPTDELVQHLGHADMRVRLAAQRRLVAARASAGKPLALVASDIHQPLLGRLHAIWALGELGEKSGNQFDVVTKLTSDTAAEVRAQAAKTLGRAAKLAPANREPISASLLPLLTDPAPRVRAFAAISLGKLKCAAALPGLLKMARENDNRDPVIRHAVALGLAGSQTPEALASAAKGAGDAERLAIVVALGRQKSKLAGLFLDDPSARVRLEAARAIWDTPIPEAYGALAAAIGKTPANDEPLVRRSLAANLFEGTSENLRAVVRFGLNPELSDDRREQAWSIVRQWPSPSPRDPVHGSWRPAAPRTREQAVAVLAELVPAMLDTGRAGAPALVVAAELGVQEAFEPLLGVIEKDDLAKSLHARAIAALGNAQDAVATHAIDSALKSDRAEVRSAARRLLVQRFPDRSAGPLRDAAEYGTMSERQTAIDLLAGLARPEAGEAIGAWMARVQAGDCPPELVLNVLEAAGKSKDAAIVEPHDKYVAKLAQQGPTAASSASLLGGDAERGSQLFAEREALACRRCHSIKPGQTLVGPNLADVGLRRNRSELLDSIIAPNAKIAEGFKTTVFLLHSGKVIAGIVRREDDKHVVVVDPDSKEIDIDPDTVENRSEGLSAMPEDIAKQLTPRELRDLVEYLSSLRTKPDDATAAASAEAETGTAAAH